MIAFLGALELAFVVSLIVQQWSIKLFSSFENSLDFLPKIQRFIRSFCNPYNKGCIILNGFIGARGYERLVAVVLPGDRDCISVCSGFSTKFLTLLALGHTL